jgi:hypothetical protein
MDQVFQLVWDWRRTITDYQQIKATQMVNIALVNVLRMELEFLSI